MKIDKILISNYKNIGSKFIGFEHTSNFNILIGQNNIGKSTLLQSISLLCSKNDFSIKSHDSLNLIISLKPTESEIRQQFPENTFGGNISESNHYEFGKKFINKKIVIQFPVFGFSRSNIKLIDIEGEDKELIEKKYSNINQFADLGYANIINTLKKVKVIKLSADRDLIPELQTINKEVSDNGYGATNLLRQYLNVSTLPNEIVEVDILNALNDIMRPENQFSRIMCQEIQNSDKKDITWEIMLTSEYGKIPISDSGSGLRTILLVLIKLLLEPREKNIIKTDIDYENFIFIFEELENNLHPSIQRNLFEFLYNWSIKNNTQIFITTHSNIPLNIFSGKENVTVTHIKKGKEGLTTNSALSFIESDEVLLDLGVKASDILQSNAVIWVEGPSDRVYINRWIHLFTDGLLKENIHYQILFYGGRLLSHISGNVNQDEELVQLFRANRHSIIVMDSDKTSKNKHINSTKKRVRDEFSSNGSMVWITQGKEIENYLSKSVINEYYNVNYQISQYEKIDDFLNSRSGKKELGKKYVTNKVKESINISKLIDKEDLEILDLKFQLSKIVEKIKAWNGL